MIRLHLAPKRRRYMRETLDVGDPDIMVREVLAVQATQILVPIRHARALAEWTGRCHAYFGLGYPTTLIEMRAKLGEWFNDLEGHPAMWGHGMLGQPRSLPISCWEVTGASPPGRLYALDPSVGREGFLVPTKERIGETRGIITAWTFEPSPHGGPRPESTMFRSSFGTRQEPPHDPAKEEAAREAVRAAILGRAHEADADQPPLQED